jgi:hypothetical protein
MAEVRVERQNDGGGPLACRGGFCKHASAARPEATPYRRCRAMGLRGQELILDF